MARVDKARVKKLNDREIRPERSFVLYWIQQNQRVAFNHALAYAIELADDLEQPLIGVFALMDDYPEAAARHYAFMLEGLSELYESLAQLGVKLLCQPGDPVNVVARLSLKASAVVCDRGDLRHDRQWRRQLAKDIDVPLVQVESHLVVPVETASDKREYAARTLRPKLARYRERFLKPLSIRAPRKSSLPLPVVSELDARRGAALIDAINVDGGIGPVSRFSGGARAARKKLEHFLRQSLDGYASARKDPAKPLTSELSPYLHFGQISPIEVALKTLDAKSGGDKDKEAFLEELIVRRELAANFVAFEPDYDRYAALPDWARQTLAAHVDDKRPARYTCAQMEAAETADRYWNAAMVEGLTTGYIHNYMRMYWGKRVLEWCNTPQYAFRTLLSLNNRYLLDGRDAASFANVGWVFGLHDRPWQERKVFGKVRYMNAKGLERKFDIGAYVDWAQTLI